MIPKRKKMVKGKVTLENGVERLRSLIDDMKTNPDKYAEMGKQQIGNPITIGSRVIEPDKWTAKQIERAVGAKDTWKTGVMKPRRNPIDSAIKANEKRVEKLLASIKDKKWEKAMAKIDIDLMYKIIEATDPEAFASGVERRKVKIEATYKELQPMVLALAETIDAMPDKTEAEREKRLLMARRGMIEIGKKRRGL